MLIKKFIGRQLKANSYKVKVNECYAIPSDFQQRSKTIAQEDIADDYIDFQETGHTSGPVTISQIFPEDSTLAPYQETLQEPLAVPVPRRNHKNLFIWMTLFYISYRHT